VRRNFVARFGNSAWTGFYATREQSQNWYFAIGSFAYTLTAAVLVTPPDASSPLPVAHIMVQLHVVDRYDWDRGRSATIAGVHVANDVIGRMQVVGLAREYDVVGHAKPMLVEVPLHCGPNSRMPIRDRVATSV
jgi:hypothetical protein